MTLFQAVAFRLWGITRVSRRAHLLMDRHELAYLTPLQRLNCLYCSYANGVIAFARAVAAATEQYWCPIKHEDAPSSPHERYQRFAPYGDGAGLAERIDALREEMRARD
ncbi:MAG: hypothetical protein AB7L26_05410 [Hyphomonadaceae bacterium]